MTEDKTDIRDRLLDAALPIVAFDGWSDATLKAAAAETDIDWPVARAVFPRGGIDMALAQHARGDAAMIAKLKEGTPPDMRYRDKVAHAVRLRIEAAGDREVVRRAVALFALPHLAPEGARALWNTADAIWTALGDTSEDYNWYTKRATLSGVYSSTVLFWLGDDSAGHQATWDFLDRRIEDVMQFEKLKAGVEKNPLLKPVLAVPSWLLGRVRRPQRGPGGYPGWTGPRP